MKSNLTLQVLPWARYYRFNWIGSIKLLTVAHIVWSAPCDYSDFGVKNNCIDEIDVFSVRIFMPLCGSEGADGICHDAIDKHQIQLRFVRTSR